MVNRANEKHPTESSDNKRAKSPYKKVTEKEPYDVIVIGAGICGIIFLKYALDKGLRCIALEKQSDVGGLWNWLPPWQDLQNLRQDIALNGVPLKGVDQPAVHEYTHEWVRRYGLESHIRLDSEVSGVIWINGGWKVQTKQGDMLQANNLVVASGVQNEPWMPDVERSDSEILEKHSSVLQKPETMKGQRITVVGGGASSQDLLNLAIENGAKDIHWVYRHVKWFLPTRNKKQKAWPNLRELGFAQSFQKPETVNNIMRWLLRFRYNRYNISELEPAEPFDFGKHQLIPGRYPVIRKLNTIHRHQAEVRSMHEHEITLKNGDRFETDQVLWSTGFRMNLGYLGLPEYSKVHRLADLLPKVGSLVRSLDYPNLFFVGMTLINSSSSTPFLAAVEAKTIISHIQGKCEIPEKTLPHHLTYRELNRYFATFDRDNYPGWWKLKYFWLSLWYEVMHNRSVSV